MKMIQEQTMRSQNRQKMAETTIQILQASLDDNNNIPLTVAMVADNNHNDSTNITVSNASSLPSATTLTKTVIQLPDNILESLHRLDHFPNNRYRWNTNEEIAAMLISIDQHEKWLSQEVQLRPKSGSMLLYSRKHVHYRRDGYCWKKRKDGKTTREDHMKLKVQGIECIYGCYVHSAILPTFHRRCYWLLQNPNIVLVHYLNVPYNDDNKIISRSLNSLPDTKKEWTREDLLVELKPMFFSIINENENNNNNNNCNEYTEELERSTLETIETIVQQLLLKQHERLKTSSSVEDPQATEMIQQTNNATNTATKNNHNPNSLNGNSNDLQSGRAMAALTDNLNANVNNNSSKAHQIFTSLSSGQIVEASAARGANTTRLKRDATTITASIANQTAASNVVDDAVDINGNSLILQQPHSQQQNTVHGLLLGGGGVSGEGSCFTFETPTSQNLQQQTSPTSLILNMSQIQPSFIILNNQNDNSNNNNNIDENDSGRCVITPTNHSTNQVIGRGRGGGGGGRSMAISDQNTVSSILSFVTYRQQQQSSCLTAKLSSNRTDTPTSSSSASSLSPLSSCSSLSNNSGIAFKVPINVGINTDPFSALASSVCPPTSSTILSSFSGTTMNCGTKTKNSVMTPILTPMAGSVTIRSPKNKKNDGAMEEEEIGHAHRHHLLTTTVLADEIEMDTLNDLDGVGTTSDGGGNFNLDDEESMLICSNASTPERTIINNHQHKHHNLNNMINNNLHNHHDASFDAFDSLYDDHGAGLVHNHHNSNASDRFVSNHNRHHQHDDGRVSVVSVVDHHTFDTGQSIDFMDHEDIPTSDDILFNLETFDMFTEFDQLDSQSQHEETTATDHDVGLEVVNQLNTNKTEMQDNNQDQHDNDNHHHNDGSGTNTIRPLLCGTFETTPNMIAQPESCGKDKIDCSNEAQDVAAAADDDDDQENIPISVQEFWNNQTGQTRSKKDSSETKTIVQDSSETIISGHAEAELVPKPQSDSLTTTSIDVTVDENGNLSIKKTLRPAGAPSRTSGGQGGTIPNVSTMSQNHPLLKRQLSAASLVMIGNGYNDHNDDNNSNNSGSSGHDHQQQQEQQQQKNPAPGSIECRRLYYSSSSPNTAAADVNHKGGLDNNDNLPQTAQKINITDYSPEWCYTEGGIKVLVAGPWCDHGVGDSNHYSILFDNIPVPTELVQNGLLRCFSPKHGPGLVKLNVSCNDMIISNSVIFEYRLFSASSFNHHHNATSSNSLTTTNAYLNLPGTNQNSLYFSQSKKITVINTNNRKPSLDHIKADTEQEEQEERN